MMVGALGGAPASPRHTFRLPQYALHCACEQNSELRRLRCLGNASVRVPGDSESECISGCHVDRVCVVRVFLGRTVVFAKR